MGYPSFPKTNMKSEGSGNVTGLKFENCTRTQSRTRSPTLGHFVSWPLFFWVGGRAGGGGGGGGGGIPLPRVKGFFFGNTTPK